MKCTSCGQECFENESPEVVFKDEKNCICENCSIDYEEVNGEIRLRENEFDKISEQGALEYLSCHIESLHDRIAKGDPRKPLYEEQIMFFSKIKEMCEKHINSTSRV
jgi:shikimate kinase